MNKKTLLDLLNTNSRAIVTFEKANGDTRVMSCTRQIESLAEEFVPKGTSNFDQDASEQIRVFDLESKGWRSFNFNRIQSVKLKEYTFENFETE